jgi:hypothetical protein
MYEGKIKVNNKEIPRTLLGTSPFVAAPQFGHRARLYQIDLYNNPENIFKIIKKSFEMGINGIQVIPYPPVIEAINLAVEAGISMDIIGTVRPEKENEDIEIFSDLNAVSMMIHGVTTDAGNWDFIESYLLKIKDEGAIPGLVTHRPFQTTQKLLKSPLLDLFDIYSVPVNKLGYLMDCDMYGVDERSELDNMIRELDKTVMAKKILAAGVLKPDEAFNYLKTVDFTDIVALGIASETEAMETFKLLASL